MKEIISSITSKGQVTIPLEVRRRLGVGTPDKVAFVLEDEGIRLRPATTSLGQPLRLGAGAADESVDLEREIEEAMGAAADRIVGRVERP